MDYKFQIYNFTGSTPLENERMSHEKGPSQKERIVFQPAFFRGYVSFAGSNWIDFTPEQLGIDHDLTKAAF